MTSVKELVDSGEDNMFTYEPLPSTTSIRLLELQRSPPGEIECTLITADLRDQPRGLNFPPMGGMGKSGFGYPWEIAPL